MNCLFVQDVAAWVYGVTTVCRWVVGVWVGGVFGCGGGGVVWRRFVATDVCW